MDERLTRLLDFFRTTGPVAVAYSGGVDSSLVLWAAATALGDGALGVTIRSEFICSEDRRRADAVAAHLAREVGARVVSRTVAVLARPDLRANPADRCYLCKRLVMRVAGDAARETLGVETRLAEGTNADDDPTRPGLRAVAEAGALSPLAALGLRKAEVRELARLAGLPNADSPSDSCLATRVPTGSELTFARLTAIEGLERTARSLGLTDLRARLEPPPPDKPGPDGVRLLVPAAQMLVAKGLAHLLHERATFIGFAHFALGERP